MLSDITSAFEESNPGVSSFETFAAACLDEVRRDPENACLYFLLGQTAKQFYDQFADQPQTMEQATQRKDAMLGLARDAVAALDASAAEKYETLNRIARAAAGEG